MRTVAILFAANLNGVDSLPSMKYNTPHLAANRDSHHVPVQRLVTALTKRASQTRLDCDSHRGYPLISASFISPAVIDYPFTRAQRRVPSARLPLSSRRLASLARQAFNVRFLSGH
jgi:hypothetical protein